MRTLYVVGAGVAGVATLGGAAYGAYRVNKAKIIKRLEVNTDPKVVEALHRVSTEKEQFPLNSDARREFMLKAATDVVTPAVKQAKKDLKAAKKAAKAAAKDDKSKAA
jgi:hypothetical protein